MRKPIIHTNHPQAVNNKLPDPPALNRDAIEQQAKDDRAKEHKTK
ncbi:MAG: hypothetical protein P4L40_01070 [Terracidiphilus sp.]|nr:hypothetical protein [Terracidiphilus sp.]